MLHQVQSLLEELSGGAEAVFVGGFSMGGAQALNLLRRPLPASLRGIFSIGSFLTADSALLNRDLATAATGPPVLMMHGHDDQLVSAALGRTTASSLLLGGVDVQFREYAGLAHEVGEEQLADLLCWMDDAIHRQSGESKAGLVGCDRTVGRVPSEDSFPFLIESDLGNAKVRVRFMVPAGA